MSLLPCDTVGRVDKVDEVSPPPPTFKALVKILREMVQDQPDVLENLYKSGRVQAVLDAKSDNAIK